MMQKKMHRDALGGADAWPQAVNDGSDDDDIFSCIKYIKYMAFQTFPPVIFPPGGNISK